MKRFTFKVAAGAAALAAAGSALANTSMSIGANTDGNGSSIFVDVIDSTNQTSFIYDVGKRYGNWPDTGLSVSLANDANWSTFISGVGASDQVTYQVQGYVSIAPSTFKLDMTGTTPGSMTNSNLKSLTGADTFINAVNNSTSSTTNSLYAALSSNPAAYGGALSLGTTTSQNPPSATLGTALNFFQWTMNGTINLTQANRSQLSGQWDLTKAGLLTYGTVGAVPLPPSLTLLLSGGVLVALIARRRRSAAEAPLGGALA